MSARLLGWYHIAGAAAGFGVTLWAWSQHAALVGGSLAFALVPFATCLGAGYYVLHGARRGFRLAVLAQLLQIPIIVLPAVTWKFIAGVIASLTVSAASGAFAYFGLEGTWLVGWHSTEQPLPPTVGVNFAPIVVLVWLFASRRTFSATLDGPLRLRSNER